MPRACAVAVVIAALGAATPLAGQTSVYGIRGLGFPGRALTPRARAMGGGLGAFDPVSPLNPAAVAGVAQVTALAVAAADFRGYEVGGADVGGLHATRFPLMEVAGRLPGVRLGYAFSMTQYTERSFDVSLTDTIVLRGTDVQVTDRSSSSGGASDIRGALGWEPRAGLRLGAGVHVVTGSAKLAVSRTFSDSAAYRPFRRVNEERVSGFGVSGGLLWAPAAGFQVALAGRYDTQANLEVDSTRTGSVDLPVSALAGLEVRPVRALRWASTFIWRSWGDADPDLSGRAFNTWELGSGVELGGPESGASRVPLRLGARYATLPFSPTDDQAHEVDVAFGTGFAFAGNRGLVDLVLERAFRSGAGARERAWQFSASLTVRP
jgi:hypothetical protein